MEQNKKPKMKLWKKILIGIAILFILTKIFGNNGKKDDTKTAESNKTSVESTEKVKDDNKSNTKEEETKQEEPKQEESKVETKEDVPREYKNALKAAESYIQTMPFSKQGLYDQLISEHGSKFPEDAAQYAIDNLQVDYKEQALKAAKNYMDTMPMSDSELYDQLISEYGEKYTPEEAQYAIDNLDK